MVGYRTVVAALALCSLSASHTPLPRPTINWQRRCISNSSTTHRSFVAPSVTARPRAPKVQRALCTIVVLPSQPSRGPHQAAADPQPSRRLLGAVDPVGHRVRVERRVSADVPPIGRHLLVPIDRLGAAFLETHLNETHTKRPSGESTRGDWAAGTFTAFASRRTK